MNTSPSFVNSVVEPNVSLAGALEFKGVDFIYPDSGIHALKDLSFKLEKGQKMAIIGRTGSGKTTIADLLVRMYDVNEGEISIDGRNIKTYDLNNLRDKIGYVTQDVFLFSDTVSNNIAFSKNKADQNEIETFAKYASVHEDIKGLENGYSTMVGERGVTLSGGQKQRISIARALIKKPDIIILDDCLSAVDTDTETNILKYLNTHLAGKTSIIITHRIYSLLDFDKIIVIDNGTIVESGNHEALLAQKGFYYELHEAQKVIEQENNQ